jgi:hypothetical protein
MVRPERFELPTLWFVARCSIQLSYGRAQFTAYLHAVAQRKFVRQTCKIASFGSLCAPARMPTSCARTRPRMGAVLVHSDSRRHRAPRLLASGDRIVIMVLHHGESFLLSNLPGVISSN